MSEERYEPIDCGDYDQLEALATNRRRVRVRYRDEQGGTSEANGHIVDLYAKDGVEYARMDGGENVRLDRLDAVDAMHEPTSNRGEEAR